MKGRATKASVWAAKAPSVAAADSAKMGRRSRSVASMGAPRPDWRLSSSASIASVASA
ncbi:Uncharacterised protein [Bordetella pertussis]|nr:Uncharacterised protein [Bordetella pertussis]CFM11164.1 Uncharacterised protein [Bordetella pertussis]CFM20333.1 Uncharacterised protein [Bordetella pertussis]CFM46415.1 Uncharacterised protein [Bordetella pertussis]CFM46719.1 Uncharacterised protein [Bordetella pertussis]